MALSSVWGVVLANLALSSMAARRTMKAQASEDMSAARMDVVETGAKINLTVGSAEVADVPCDEYEHTLSTHLMMTLLARSGYGESYFVEPPEDAARGLAGCPRFSSFTLLVTFLLSTEPEPFSNFREDLVASLGSISHLNTGAALRALTRESDRAQATDSTAYPVWPLIASIGAKDGFRSLAARPLISAIDSQSWETGVVQAIYGLASLASGSTDFEEYAEVIACLKRKACNSNYPQVLGAARGSLSDLGEFGPKTSGYWGSCEYSEALAGSPCFNEVSWAMSTGIREHPEWYPGLTASSSFSEFQSYLYYLPRCRNPAKPPCYNGAEACYMP